MIGPLPQAFAILWARESAPWAKAHTGQLDKESHKQAACHFATEACSLPPQRLSMRARTRATPSAMLVLGMDEYPMRK